MNIIQNQENLGHSIDNNKRSLKKIKSNHNNQQQINKHYDSFNITNSKVQMAN